MMGKFSWRSLGVGVAFHPFFWAWDLSWKPGWGALSIDLGPFAVRLFLARPRGISE